MQQIFLICICVTIKQDDAINSINQSINLFCHTQTQLAVNNKIANTFRLCVTGSTQGAYAPHKRASHVQ